MARHDCALHISDLVVFERHSNVRNSQQWRLVSIGLSDWTQFNLWRKWARRKSASVAPKSMNKDVAIAELDASTFRIRGRVWSYDSDRPFRAERIGNFFEGENHG